MTFYHRAFDNNDATTILQVVAESQLAETLHLLCPDRSWHGHSIRDASNQRCQTSRDLMKKAIPWLISLVLVIWVISKMIPHRQASPG